MFGRITLFAVFTLMVSSLALPAWAQDEEDSAQARRLPSLSERLERFRQDLLGEPRNAPPNSSPSETSSGPQPPRRSVPNNGTPNNNSSGMDRRISAPPRAAGVIPAPQTQRPNPVQANARPAVESPPLVNSAVTAPARLESQSARRAQPSTSPTPAMIEAADRTTQDFQEKPAPVRHSAIRPRRVREEESEGEEDREPHIARSLPSPIAPKETEGDAEEATRFKSSKPTAGVLFTTQGPALSVEATGPHKVMIGKEAQFLIKIRNTGSAANNVVLTINIPNYAEVVSVQPSAGSAPPPRASERRESLEWKISRLDAKSSETLTLKIIPHKSAPLDLAAQWTYTPELSQTLVEVQEPKLVMGIAGPDEVRYGQSKVYKLTVSNPGNGDTENVTIALLPIGRASEGVANHRIGTLHAGESKTVDIELTARQAGVITIRAQAFADGGLRSEAVEQVLVRRASLRVEVQAPTIKYAGTVGTYRVSVINSGNATAENVQVAAMLPPDAKYVSSNGGGRHEAQQNKVSWTVGTLQAGSDRIFEMQCALGTPGENRMQFLATADGDLNATQTTETHVEALADLKLEVRDPRGPVAVGEDTVYEVHLRNRGTKAAENIDLAVFFSDGLEATMVEGGPNEIGPGQVIFKPIALLPAGDTAVYRIHARAEKAGNHVFRSEVICNSLQTKLAAEETTHFYGDDKPTTVGTARGSDSFKRREAMRQERDSSATE